MMTDRMAVNNMCVPRMTTIVPHSLAVVAEFRWPPLVMYQLQLVWYFAAFL
jgi:hypothetical protein